MSRKAGVSINFAKEVLDGAYAQGGPYALEPMNACFGAVDVRDVARAHVAALQQAWTHDQRIIVSSAQVGNADDTLSD